MSEGALHITSGDSAAGGLLAGLRCPRSAILVHRDVLSCGPLPPIDDLAAWLAGRRRFWDSLVVEVEGADGREMPGWTGRFPDGDLTAQLPRLGAAETVTVWLGRALSDQLLLAWLVRVADLIQFDLGRLRLVQWMDHPGTGNIVRGVDEITPDRIAVHPPPQKLSDGAIEELRRAWDAVTAAAPDDLLEVIAGRGVSVALRPALARLLGRYPEAASGLGRWDRALLGKVGDSATGTATVLGKALLEATNELDCVGDIYLSGRLRRLARGAHPLLVLGPGRSASVCLTDAGREVLAERVSAVALNGLDDWVCGVHLQSSAGGLWFRHGDTLMRSIP